jgi:peptide/nickel transport system substrate-binding protein
MRINWWYSLMVLTIVALALSACAPSTPAPATKAPVATAQTAATAAPKPTIPISAAAAAAASPAPTAASSPTPPKEMPARGGIMVRTNNSAWSTMDPQRDQTDSNIGPVVFNFLTRYIPNEQTNRYEVAPDLAESWQLVDPKTLVLKIRKGVKFHDGTDFDANIAKWNIERMQKHPKSTSKQYVSAIATMDTPDAYTLKLNLSSPSSPQLINLSSEALGGPVMMSKAAVEAHDDDWVAKNPTGTGPFQFVEWKTDDRVVTKKFENHWEMGLDGKSLPYMDGITTRYISEETVAVTELRTGNADWVQISAKQSLDTLKNVPTVQVLPLRQMSELPTLAFNMQSGRFKDNLNLRKAVAYAIDRDSLIKALGKPSDYATCYFLSEGQPGYDTAKVPCYNYDPAKAKQALADAGFPNGIDVSLLAVNRALDRPQAEILKQMLDQVGIRITIDLMERLAWVAKTQSLQNWEMTTLSAKHNVDPDTTFTYRLLSTASGNYSGWKDADFDKCIMDGREAYELPKAQEVYARCSKMVYDKLPMIPMWAQRGPVALSARVQNLKPYWQATDRWGQVWLKK